MSDLLLRDVEVLGDEGKPILNIEHLALKSGACLAVRGISGAGKSTLLQAISGNVPPDSGQIIWGDVDIAALSENKKAQFRRDNMGIIFQHFPLFEELSVFENITIARHFQPKNKANIQTNAKRLMQHFAFDDVNRAVKTYSGGQRQRIAFMRALVTNPAIVLADEPTAALDRDNAKKMVDFLSAKKGDTTIVVTSHDEAVLECADIVLTIDAGQLTEAG